VKNRGPSGTRDDRIAEKRYYSMGDVCKLTELEPHVLRYWESQFRSLRPTKNRSGNRVFRRKEIDLIFLIRYLLYE
jgi:DNA-binding transcriptional MerR regulator